MGAVVVSLVVVCAVPCFWDECSLTMCSIFFSESGLVEEWVDCEEDGTEISRTWWESRDSWVTSREWDVMSREGCPESRERCEPSRECDVTSCVRCVTSREWDVTSRECDVMSREWWVYSLCLYSWESLGVCVSIWMVGLTFARSSFLSVECELIVLCSLKYWTNL